MSFERYLGRHPELIARNAAPLDGHAQVAVVFAHLRGVDQPAALSQVLEGALDERLARR